MHPVRIVLFAMLASVSFAFAQEGAASKSESLPAPATRPESRPSEVRVRHPRIGIRVETTALERDHVARVEAVTPTSPADKAGLKVGDVILKIGSEEIRDDKTYREAMSRKRPGESVTLRVRRSADELDLEVALVDKLARQEPEAVTVQHILIGCGDKAPSKSGKGRSVEDARKLAESLAAKAKNGADFGEMVKSYSEDGGSARATPPGVYKLVLDGKPKPSGEFREFSQMVLGFSAVAFALEVDDIAVTPYDNEISPYGFHIIKRIK